MTDRCSCGPHAIVYGQVPDAGCPFHGRHTDAVLPCTNCGNDDPTPGSNVCLDCLEEA